MIEDQPKTTVEKPASVGIPEHLKVNLGTRPVTALRPPRYPDAGAAVRNLIHARPTGAVDVLLVNPPSPDGGIWIRTQHRVGRRSREEMIWPQCSLAQHAAMLGDDYSFEIIDAIAESMDWKTFEARLRQLAPRYYITQCTAPTLTNDMYGVMLAKSLGAVTMAFGTHVTAMPTETLRDFPALDLVLRGEPELTFREIIDVFEARQATRPVWVQQMIEKCDPTWEASAVPGEG
jgi:anaerobic magnesium-protoporphyrin IX monomethyl ester cyclase